MTEKVTTSANPCKILGQSEALELARRVSGEDASLVRYQLRPYSDDLLGTLGLHRRLELETHSLRDGTERHGFFVKMIPYDEPREAAYVKEKRVFEQESRFFGDVAPLLTRQVDVEPWAPECHLVRSDVLVFEDLGERGYALRGPTFDEETMKSALGTVARLHAASMLAEARLGRSFDQLFPDAFWEMTFMGHGKTHGWCTTGIDAACTVADSLGLDSSRIPGLYREVLDAVKQESITRPSSQPSRRVISHGDLWANNVMFDGSYPARCRLVDFQFTRYASPGQDLVLLLQLCGSRELRARRETELIGFYHARLAETLARNAPSVGPPSLEELRAAVERERRRAVVSAAIYASSVFVSRRFAAGVIDDPVEYQRFQYQDRRDKVLEFMRIDEVYRARVEDAVRDLVEFADKS